MDLFDTLVIAIFVIFGALLFYVLYQRKGIYKQSLVEYPDAEIISVRFSSRDMVAAGQPPSKASGAGYLILSGSDCLIRGKHPNTGIEEKMAFGSDTKIVLIHKVNSAIGLLTLQSSLFQPSRVYEMSYCKFLKLVYGP